LRMKSPAAVAAAAAASTCAPCLHRCILTKNNTKNMHADKCDVIGVDWEYGNEPGDTTFARILLLPSSTCAGNHNSACQATHLCASIVEGAAALQQRGGRAVTARVLAAPASAALDAAYTHWPGDPRCVTLLPINTILLLLLLLLSLLASSRLPISALVIISGAATLTCMQNTRHNLAAAAKLSRFASVRDSSCSIPCP
jgi:hypothetical protein